MDCSSKRHSEPSCFVWERTRNSALAHRPWTRERVPTQWRTLKLLWFHWCNLIPARLCFPCQAFWCLLRMKFDQSLKRKKLALEIFLQIIKRLWILKLNSPITENDLTISSSITSFRSFPFFAVQITWTWYNVLNATIATKQSIAKLWKQIELVSHFLKCWRSFLTRKRFPNCWTVAIP